MARPYGYGGAEGSGSQRRGGTRAVPDQYWGQPGQYGNWEDILNQPPGGGGFRFPWEEDQPPTGGGTTGGAGTGGTFGTLGDMTSTGKLGGSPLGFAGGEGAFEPSVLPPVTGGGGTTTIPTPDIQAGGEGAFTPDGGELDFGDLLFQNWQQNAGGSFDPQQIFDALSKLPATQRNMELYGPLVKELQDLIASKGMSGIVPVEKQFANVARDLTQQSAEGFRQTKGELARMGALESGGLATKAVQAQIALNQGLGTARVAIETATSREAAGKYSQALDQIQKLQEQAANQEINWFDALTRVQSLSAENQREWAKMGMSERLTVMGYDVEKYKADMQGSLDRERLALEKQLGFAELDLKALMESHGYDIEKAKLSLQDEMMRGGWSQQEADRALTKWSELLRAEVQNKRTDVDMINAMGQLQKNEWDHEIQQADLELKRYLGDQQYNVLRAQMAQDWDRFVEQQAFTRWIASNQWEVDKWIARTQADANKKGWFAEFWSGLGGIIPG